LRAHHEKAAKIENFSEAYAQSSRLPQGLCPFTAHDYRDMIDGGSLMEMMQFE
tara:strand:- start:793 stop:951 length:159 start_codon:yes stop_codon:yes gene_type:complete